MGFEADISADWEASLAALAWQYDCGIDEAIEEVPINRYDVVVTKPAPRQSGGPTRAALAQGAGQPGGDPRGQTRGPVPEAPPPPPAVDAVEVARMAAANANTLEELRAAVDAFDLCELKKGARTTVFADGDPRARVLILGEAPGREENIAGMPFVGREGQLLDRMFAAIGLSRQSPDPNHSLYLTKVLYWQPLGAPDPQQIAMMLPFVKRQIDLVDPDVVVAMGNIPLAALTGKGGISRLRGKWSKIGERPLLPMLDPNHLLRNPAAKRQAWADLLALQAFLQKGG